jgi:hypothetical protein
MEEILMYSGGFECLSIFAIVASGVGLVGSIAYLVSKRYDYSPGQSAVYPVNNDAEALEKVKEAYSKNDLEKIDFIGFDKEGRLIQKIKKNGKEKSETNRIISLDKHVNTLFLKVRVFEDKEHKKAYYDGLKIHEYLSR